MEFAADLHIHSALSPCASNDMTPNNIINMAILKGLDIISVTDHNNASNLQVIHKLSLKKGIMLLPGIEVQTKEEVHMLCYFKRIDEAVAFGNGIYNLLPNISNNTNLFGEQIVFDEDDNITGHLDKLLLSSADISLEQLIYSVYEMGGACIPAHVDRNSYSIISNLGFIPQNLGIKTVEVSRKYTFSSSEGNTIFGNYRTIRDSDAHYLYDISERENFINLKSLTMGNLISYLNGI
jgi:Uncharacterized conserved protein